MPAEQLHFIMPCSLKNVIHFLYGCDILNPPEKHFQGGDSEYYGCETSTYWFPWLGGGGSKYYGCDISNPQKTFSGWGSRILLL
jgi:hypothetical protein